jgi:hypothetical protein
VTSLQDPEAARWRAVEHALALADGSSTTVGRLWAANMTAWLVSPRQDQTASAESVSGPGDTVQALGRLAPCALRVLAAVHGERDCWAEITRGVERREETCVVGLRHDPGGAVSRLVWLRAPLVPPLDAGEPDAAPDGRPIMERYFADLMRSEFRSAAAHFTADTIYSHPPYRAGSERVLFRGRDALWRGFVSQRGPSPVRQVITGFWQQHARMFVEGVVEGIPNGGTFVSTAQLTAGGEIARYVAFYSAQRLAEA